MTNTADDRHVTQGVWITLGEIGTSLRVAGAGFDWICLDQQHGVVDRAALVAYSRAAPAGSPALAVRVPQLDVAAIGFALDAGASIVIVPLIENAEEARRAVSAAHYPPRGGRSWGPLEPLWHGTAPTAADAHERTQLWIMIETAGALDQIDDILAVEGIDGVFVGPYDLSIALGLTLDELVANTAPDAPLSRIVTACRAAGVRPGAFAGSPARAEQLAAIGFQDLAVATDVSILDAGVAALLPSATKARSSY